MHTHILPALDDGSANLDMSVAMLEIAYRSGTRHVVATPHFAEEKFVVNRQDMYAAVEQLRSEMFLRDMNIEIYPGHEVRCATDVIEKFRAGEISTLNDSGFMLLELPFMSVIPNFVQLFIQIQAETRTRVIFAHPERHECVRSHPELIDSLIERGIMIQINADSIRGNNGKPAKAFAERLLKNNSVSFVASDAHDNMARIPALDDVYKIVRSKYGEKTAKKIFYENQMNILKGRAPV